MPLNILLDLTRHPFQLVQLYTTDQENCKSDFANSLKRNLLNYFINVFAYGTEYSRMV